MARTDASKLGGFRAPASIEVTAKHALETANLGELFPKGTRVYLADLGTHDAAGLVSAAARLTACGYKPIPHMAARRMKNLDDFEDRLARFTGDAGVTEVLMVAGSPERQVGPFPSSLVLLETGSLVRHGIKEIVVAGHPEGSPDFPASELLPALKTKQAYGRDTGTSVKIATQFSFDINRVLAWERELQAAGIDMPIHIGLAGPAKITTLIKYAAMCGVGQSLSFLKKRGGALAALAMSYAPDDVAAPLEAHIADNANGLITDIHMFPFGGLVRAADWLVERGNWVRPMSSAA